MNETRTFSLLIPLLTALAIAPLSNAGSAGLESFFPDAASIDPGMTMEDYQEYGRDGLFDYINGGAEVYLDLGFVKVGARDYIIEMPEETWFTVDIFDMGSAKSATTIYSSEAPPEPKAVEVGDAGYIGGGSLIFRQGQYYIKIRADDDSQAINKMLGKFAAFLSTEMKCPEEGTNPDKK